VLSLNAKEKADPDERTGGYRTCCGLSYCTWYSIVLSIVLFLGVGFVVGYFFVLPSIVNSRIDAAVVTVDGAELVTKDGTLHLTATLNFSNVDIPFGMAAHLTRTTLQWYYKGVQIGTVVMTPQNFQGSEFQLSLASKVAINSHDAWDEFAGDMLRAEGLVHSEMKSVDAHVHVSVLGVDWVIPVSIDKEIGIQGLSGLRDVTVVKYDAFNKASDEGAGFRVDVDVIFHNPTNVAVYNAGVIRAHLWYKSLNFGNFYSNQSVTLKPGNNHVLVSGSIYKGVSGVYLDEFMTHILNYTGPRVPVVIQLDPLHPSDNAYFREAMKGLTLPAEVPPVNGSVATEMVFSRPPTKQELEEWAKPGGHLEMEGFLGFKAPISAESDVHHLAATYSGFDPDGVWVDWATVNVYMNNGNAWHMPGRTRWHSPVLNTTFSNLKGKEHFDLERIFTQMLEEGQIFGTAAGSVSMKINGVEINAKISLPDIPACFQHNQEDTCEKHFPP
jgi:hypothetical protein